MGAQLTDGHLNAFVDGELAPHEAARVALAIASDSAVAQRVARLHQMKAAVAGFAGMAAPPDLPQPRPRPVWGRAARLAGAAAALVLLGLTAPGLHHSAPVVGAPALTALAQHDHWVAQTQNVNRPALPDNLHWLAPVMQSSRLQLVHLARAENALHLGFKGPNACRMSLFVTQANGADGALRMDLSAETQRAQWQSGRQRFEMIARDMAPARFATVATGLHQNSRAPAADPALQVALLNAARLPCIA